jgi:formate hydrogenlyase transcriptional activator
VISPIRILYLEDDPKDAELVQATLESEGVNCQITRVEGKPEFVTSLQQGGFDLILADYTLPSFDGISALGIAKEIRPEVPFIFVSGTLGEEVAIEALKLGATDYVFKTRLSRILPSVQRALREAQEKMQRHSAEDALRASEESLRLIVDTIPGLIAVQSAAGELELVNRQLLQYFGKTLEELKAWATNDTVHPDDRCKVIAAWQHSVKTGEPYDDVHRIRRADGAYRWFNVRGFALRNADGHITRWYELFNDIDDRKRAEDELQRSEAYLEEAQRLSHTGSFGWQVSSGRIYWSDETFRIFEIEPANHTTLERAFERIHPEDREVVHQTLGSATEERKDLDFEHRLLMPDGSVKYVRVVGHPREQSGVLEFVGAVTDITERKRAEEALRRSEQHLRDAIETIPTMAWTALPNGGNDFANQRWQEYTGMVLNDTSDAGWKTAFHPADLATHVDKWRASLATGKFFENEGRLRRAADGEYRWFLHRAVPLRDEGGEIIKWYGTATDIEDLKQAEAKLRQDEEELRRITDAIPLSIFVLDPDGRSIYANRVALDYTGMSLDDVVQKNFRERIFHPEDVERLRKSRLASLGSNVPFENEQRARGRDGAYRWFLVRYNPLLDEDGKVVRWYATATDIDDRKRSEDRTRNENIALRDEVDKASMFEEIVGESPALQSVLGRVSKVAPTDSTVLLTGETGTGKELIARAIHKRSARSSRAFVNVNCAAIPQSLIASELFGHERGAFTGALQRRLGRFELAEGGTIFLDEVGELPLETQIALLRVLQEREFERVGGNQSIRADVRVIAATNRDLQSAIASGGFRSDLFYRLDVIPIEIPPLRQRKEDIPLLIEYFIARYSRKAGKKIRTIEKKTLELLQSYSWPGNIRELQNVIERSVVVCETEIFSVDAGWFPLATSSIREESPARNLGRRSAAQEREVIEAALAEAQGRISGPSGAAAQLGIPPSTLESKIRTMKINKYRFKKA